MAGSREHGGRGDRESREIGALSRSEIWWRDRHEDIERCGYRLRPRYHPLWVASWRGPNDDIFSVKDGQPHLVSAIRLVHSALTDLISYGPQWMPRAYVMADELCSRRFSP